MDNGEEIIGTCLEMCPEAEIRDREKAGLIHFFEKSDDQLSHQNEYNQPSVRGRGGGRAQQQRRMKPTLKADKAKAVKEYTRPAAGVNKTIRSDLRTPVALKKTVAYLCFKILTRTDKPFIDVYDFVFDRLRAVRQDMVIQRISDETAIEILETTVKFHLYAEYRFRHNPPTSYDPCINRKHLRDCLKTLLSFYGYNHYRGPTKPFFEALYCVSSPESYEVISRAFEIRHEMLDAPVFIDALELCLAIQHRNFYKFFQLLNELPPLLAAFAVQYVPVMRFHALKAIVTAYGGMTCKIPLDWIEDMLCYPNLSRAQTDMVKIGSQVRQVDDDEAQKFVIFSKSHPFLKETNVAVVDFDVKFTVFSGLNNVDVVASEKICSWGQRYLK